MTKAEIIFRKELSLIRDKNIKNFVITCFDKFCPDYFWTCPCSTSGKYHPQVALGVGGLIRHTKLAVWWGIKLLRALGTSPELKGITSRQLQDEVIATLLMHDMIKNGKGLGSDGRPLESGVTGTHGVTLANKIFNNDDIPALNSDSFDRIYKGIAAHMGIWTTDNRYKPNNMVRPMIQAFTQLIHLADYCASCKVDNIYSILENEKNGITKRSTKKTAEGPPCPSVRQTENPAENLCGPE